MANINSYLNIWANPLYIEKQESLFKNIDNYLVNPPQRILDIGCGLAYISELFYKKYNSEIWLLDGDRNNNNPNGKRSNKWGETNDFLFYNTKENLEKSWKERDLKYRFIDASNIDIPNDIKFDLVYSWLSCGYHYPLSSYSELIKNHTNEQSIVIMDLRKKTLTPEKQETNFQIIKEFPKNGKAHKVHIKLL